MFAEFYIECAATPAVKSVSKIGFPILVQTNYMRGFGITAICRLKITNNNNNQKFCELSGRIAFSTSTRCAIGTIRSSHFYFA